TDDQGDAGDAAQQHRHRLTHLVDGRGDIVLALNRHVGLGNLVTLLHEVVELRLDARDRVLREYLHRYLTNRSRVLTADRSLDLWSTSSWPMNSPSASVRPRTFAYSGSTPSDRAKVFCPLLFSWTKNRSSGATATTCGIPPGIAWASWSESVCAVPLPCRTPF